jgi:hypothetical protein
MFNNLRTLFQYLLYKKFIITFLKTFSLVKILLFIFCFFYSKFICYKKFFIIETFYKYIKVLYKKLYNFILLKTFSKVLIFFNDL